MEASPALTRRIAKATGRDRPATPDMLAKALGMVDQFFADLDAKEAMISGDVGPRLWTPRNSSGRPSIRRKGST